MFENQIIPFYGGNNSYLFEIERRCMDREGKVISYLNHNLPRGKILDVGAGNGFTAEQIQSNHRNITAMEPDIKMVDFSKNLNWVNGVAQSMPFHTNTFDGAYATWAFFFNGIEDIELGIEELKRVVQPGGKIIIIDNYGDDEFTSFSKFDISNPVDKWFERGFEVAIINTHFIFDSILEAKELMSFYFQEKGNEVNQLKLEYKVAAFSKINNK